VKIAIFGGTFDPIHAGHVRAAEAAAQRFRLDRVLFVPAGNPPHKFEDGLTPFFHRYAMVSLACAGNRRFVPSLLEAPGPDGRLNYSIDTLRKVRKLLAPADELYCLVGLDAFLDLPQWKNFRGLLRLANFIVVSRPGFPVHDILNVIPPKFYKDRRETVRNNRVRLIQTTLHLLTGVEVPAASHKIRRAIETGETVKGLLPPAVEEYIVKEQVYSGERRGNRLR
jgi:nicotinate-nucleotide adenylyltransferase